MVVRVMAVMAALVAIAAGSNLDAAGKPEEAYEGVGTFGAFAASKEWTPPQDSAVLKKLAGWQDQKLGLLITWGTYSQWGIAESWTLVTTRYPWNKRPEKYANLDDRAYMKEYENLITTFNPVRFDADKWAAAFKDAGVKYVLPMAKHCDGFCMWDTETTDYKITSSRCPFHADARADTVKQMCRAFRKAGLSTGLYFSKPDWHCPYYWLPELGPGPGLGPNYDPPSLPHRGANSRSSPGNSLRSFLPVTVRKTFSGSMAGPPASTWTAWSQWPASTSPA